MKPVLIYDNNFYPYNGQFIAQGGDNLYLDYEIDGTRFFLVKFAPLTLQTIKSFYQSLNFNYVRTTKPQISSNRYFNLCIYDVCLFTKHLNPKYESRKKRGGLH